MGKLGLTARQVWRRLARVRAKQAKLRMELLRNQVRVNRLIWGRGFGLDEEEPATVFEEGHVALSPSVSDEMLEMASGEVASVDSRDLQ